MLVALLALNAILNKSKKKTPKVGLNKVHIQTANNINATDKTLAARHSQRKVFINTKAVIMDSDCPSNNKTIISENILHNGNDSVTSTCGKNNMKQQNDSAIIALTASDKQCCHEITTTNTTILTSPGNHDHGSSKVKLKNIVDYKWEVKNYPGHLIAVHLNERYVAYVINVNKVTRMEGMVRVTNTKNCLRTLIKGMFGEVLDLQFAHIESEHLLACIDVNSLYVHKIDECNNTLRVNLIIKIEAPLKNYVPKYDKLSWCPFIEMPGEDTEDNQLLVWSRGSVFHCFNINTIVAEHGIGPLLERDIESGFIKHEDESITITWITLSPDGSTIGAGSTDGAIRFYQVYMHEKNPRCLHQWRPHNGKPISSFFFLDNLTKNNDAYWKYTITAAVHNTEFKIWDCGSWTCLQTINMASPITSNRNVHFLAELDRTSSYLVVSNLEGRTCYVMQIIYNIGVSNTNSSDDGHGDCDADSGSSKSFISHHAKDELLMGLSKGVSSTSLNKSASANVLTLNDSITIRSTTSSKSCNFPPTVYIKSVAEFPLNSGILSFSIIDAAVRRYKCANDDYLCEDLDYYDEETNSLYCVVIRMYIVQSKSLQECHILYQPMVQENVEFKCTIMNSSQESLPSIRRNKSLLSLTMSQCGNDSLDISHNQNNTGNNNLADVADKGANKEKIKKFDVLLDGIPTSTNDNNYVTLNGAQQIGGLTKTVTRPTSVMELLTNSIALHMPSNKTDMVNATVPQAPLLTTNVSGKLNLMTPDAFTSTSTASSSAKNERKTPENVSTDVLNTILMLASVTGSGGGGGGASGGSGEPKSDNNINLFKFTKNTTTESHAVQQSNQQLQQPNQHESQTNFMAIDRNPDRNIIDNITSAGSSPSREVQEIMSLQDYDKSPFSIDELLDEDNSIQEKLEKHRIDKGQESAINTNSSNKSSRNSSTTIAAMAINNWPKIPEITTTTKHSTELQNAANLISQAVTSLTSSSNNLNNDHLMVVDALTQQCHKNNGAQNATAIRNSPDLSEINMKINELIDLIKIQTVQIKSLQNELKEIRSTKTVVADNNATTTNNNKNATTNIVELSYKLEIHLTKLMEQYMRRQENDLKRKFANFIAEKDINNQELTENIMKIMNQCILSQLSDIITKVMSHEIQRQVAPMLSNKLDTFQHQLQLDVANKLSGYDEMLKENLAEACKSKNILEAFGKSVLMGVQGSLQAAFIESMSSTLIPAYEKSSQNMFQQLHDAFSVGIKEFIEQYNNYLQQLQPMQDSTEDILNKFSGFHDNLEKLLTQHRTGIQDVLMETRKDIKTMESSLAQQLQTVIRTEVRKSMDVQATALRSQTSTPAPIYGAKDTIKTLIMQGQINKAFHQALLANDLTLVEFTLKTTDRYAVFTPNCCLEQKVLLSLIQQISADMTNHNDLKHGYLCEALLAIHHDDPIVREHAPKIIKELYYNCQLFLVSFPKSQQCSNVRILMKAVQTIIDKF